MSYGTIKVDTVTFTNDGVDKSVSISGLVQNPTFSGNVTVTGTISGVTVTGTTASFTSGNFTNISGGTHTITSGVFASGSPTNPSISFTSDPNTGIYSPGADQVAISTSGTGRLSVDANGNVAVDTNTLYVDAVNNEVGVGTTNPSATAHVQTTRQFSSASGNTSAGLLVSQSGGTPAEGAYGTAITLSKINSTRPGGAIASVQTTADDDQLGLAFLVHSSSVANDTLTEALRISHAGTATFTASSSTAPFIANIGASEVVRIDSSGRLLVGTPSTPPAVETIVPKFVSSSAAASTGAQDIAIYNYQNAGGSGRQRVGPKLLLGNSRSGTNGSLGGIVVSGDQVGNIRFAGDDGSAFLTAAEILAEVDGTPGANDMPGRLVFSTTADGASSPTERMRIDSSGRVGVGTTSPSRKLQVEDGITSGTFNLARLSSYNGTNAKFLDIRIDNTEADPSIILDAGKGGGSSPNLAFQIGSTERARIDSSGRLLVGTISARANFFNASTTSSVQVEGTTTDNSSLSIIRNSASTGSPLINFAKSRSASVGGNTLVLDGDQLGTIWFQGADDTEFVPGASIQAVVDGTPGANTMPGRLVFSTTSTTPGASPTERMRISNAGTTTLTSAASTPPFIANIGASEAARIDSSGRLLMGTFTAYVGGGNVTSRLQIHGVDGSNSGLQGTRWSDNSGSSWIGLQKSRGTSVGSRAIVLAEDVVGTLDFAADDGTNFVSLAKIDARVDGTPGANDMPGRIVLSTTLNGASSPTERLRITNDGVMCYDQAAPVSHTAAATLVVDDLKNGLIQYTGAAATLTLPTGTLTEGGFAANSLYNNITFEWSVINTGSGTCTIGAGTAHTIVGGATVAAGASGRFASRRTAANTFVSYRLS